jgi:precorrin-2 dehydrogenase/sirohydrochlorin ferrochelatase
MSLDPEPARAPVQSPGEPPGVPLLVRVAGRRVLCAGAGPIATAKALSLLDAGAELLVVAPEATPAIRQAAATGLLRWHSRRYQSADLDGALLVLAATADPAVNDRVAADADARGVLCVRVGAGDAGIPGSAALMSAVRRGHLTLAVSTGGRAPALSRRLRGALEEAYGPEYGELVELLGGLRRSPAVREHLAGLPDAERRARWRAVLDTDILTLLRAGQPEAATELAAACLCSSWD